MKEKKVKEIKKEKKVKEIKEEVKEIKEEIKKWISKEEALELVNRAYLNAIKTADRAYLKQNEVNCIIESIYR